MASQTGGDSHGEGVHRQTKGHSDDIPPIQARCFAASMWRCTEASRSPLVPRASWPVQGRLLFYTQAYSSHKDRLAFLRKKVFSISTATKITALRAAAMSRSFADSGTVWKNPCSHGV